MVKGEFDLRGCGVMGGALLRVAAVRGVGRGAWGVGRGAGRALGHDGVSY
ncbi:hypothetical protein [Alicyclobacillus acidoterrestris]|uniref:Uncharacterized protein n=1 Tax=Alicyclobacillus acidoterrestris (strain ATCC 49025 / DSM 3922 / CIP 106132 / NCIMB 13137 / GD3B) TaxID=1356854 RepID=T0BQQ3_ALIAG|nr:hypothetical protein [Alicyclobacillus acidoterrestris]EPZ42885.1 hypothetical protein N007_13865 [Alicyclobacillus acidoterrestris ATCC 49025]UNO50095.1 hypothetical protein K1I37_06295 [Alicyclobacillus acidoterrestris]